MTLPIQQDQIEKQIHINAPVERVWRALTDHHEFGQWFGVKIEAPFVAGQASTGHMTIPGYEQVKWEAIVQEVDSERFLFAYTWHPYAVETGRDYSQELPTRVEFRLQPSGRGTSLTVSDPASANCPPLDFPRLFARTATAGKCS